MHKSSSHPHVYTFLIDFHYFLVIRIINSQIAYRQIKLHTAGSKGMTMLMSIKKVRPFTDLYALFRKEY